MPTKSRKQRSRKQRSIKPKKISVASYYKLINKELQDKNCNSFFKRRSQKCKDKAKKFKEMYIHPGYAKILAYEHKNRDKLKKMSKRRSNRKSKKH